MRLNNLQLPCVQPPTSSFNLQLPHGRPGHGGHGGRGGHVGQGGQGGVWVVRVVMDRTGQDRTKLTFKLDFPGNL